MSGCAKTDVHAVERALWLNVFVCEIRQQCGRQWRRVTVELHDHLKEKCLLTL